MIVFSPKMRFGIGRACKFALCLSALISAGLLIFFLKSYSYDRCMITCATLKDIVKGRMPEGAFPSRSELLLTYMRIDGEESFYQRNNNGIFNTKMFGLDIDFYSYFSLKVLYQDIFVRRDYYFPFDAKVPVIIDCGGNIGLSIIYFKMLYPAAKVLAFEANPEIFNVLQRNIRKNSIDNVTMINKALHSHNGEVSFKHGGSLGGHIVQGADQSGSFKVPCTQLSGYITGNVDILKLDIEGGETAVIHDLAASNALRFIKNIVMEFHYTTDDSNGLADILKILEAHNFTYQFKGSNYNFEYNQRASDRGRTIMIFAHQKS